MISIFSFINAWDEFAWAHVAIRSAARRTLPITIAFFQTQFRTEWGIVFTASIVSLVPIFSGIHEISEVVYRGNLYLELEGVNVLWKLP